MQRPVPINAVIFDCDGVLVDSEPLANRALAETLTELGLPTTASESVRRYMGRSWAYVEGDVARRNGGTAPAGLAERYRARMLAEFSERLRPVPGVVDALDTIALPVCVASSGEPSKMRFTLGLTGLLDRFDGRMFSAVEVPRGKPHPDLFLHAAARLGWEPVTTAVIEDSPVGVAAGRAAGMTVFAYVGLVDPGELAEAGASAVFSDMAELPALLSPP